MTLIGRLLSEYCHKLQFPQNGTEKEHLLDDFRNWLNTFHSRPLTAAELMQRTAIVCEKVLMKRKNIFVRSMSLR